MQSQEFNKDFHLKLNAEFERIDKFLEKFQRHFIREQLFIVNEYPIPHLKKVELKEELKQYANRIFNCADSVSDKDQNYSEIRLGLELEAMTRATEKYPVRFRKANLALKTHQKAKQLLIHFFPELIELSANGFRLLEKYCLLYNFEFFSSLEEQ
ncbi:hypothetical protein SLH46_19710 [Draconibacterium sp. IB214405]|uniref:hypothetical protein n=1 Tax=Draconibacterium sp. IB214405 TaxID=3097352 RepID=UPI002A1064A9|nr:hypothetical protein [Draconibacterium sp. IB214405]MDX8341435.1 hypothetical protein [Draconibacterium sp. IB214405]